MCDHLLTNVVIFNQWFPYPFSDADFIFPDAFLKHHVFLCSCTRAIQSDIGLPVGVADINFPRP